MVIRTGVRLSAVKGLTDSARPLPKWLEGHARLAKQLNPDGKIRRVFYPLGGPDVATPLVLFTGPKGGPKELMIVDGLSFGTQGHRAALVSDAKRQQLFWRDYEGLGYATVDPNCALESMEVAGVGIQWHLDLLGATQVKIEHLDTNGQVRSERPTHPPAPATPAAERDVVRVTFKLWGEKKTLLFVQSDVTGALPPVASAFLDKGIDAIFEKAPMGMEWNQQTKRALLNLHQGHGVIAGRDLPSDQGGQVLSPSQPEFWRDGALPSLEHLKWLGLEGEPIALSESIQGGYGRLRAFRLTGLDVSRLRSEEEKGRPGASYWAGRRQWGYTPASYSYRDPRAEPDATGPLKK